jgi:hypothetical protein
MEFFFGSSSLKPDNVKLLIFGSLSNDNLDVFRAFNIYPDLIDDIGSKRVLELLSALIDRFGWNIQLGDSTQKFFFFHQFTVNAHSDSVKRLPDGDYAFRHLKILAEGDDRDYSAFYLMRQNPKPPNIEIEYALTFCINLDKYRRWIKSHKAQTAQ